MRRRRQAEGTILNRMTRENFSRKTVCEERPEENGAQSLAMREEHLGCPEN